MNCILIIIYNYDKYNFYFELSGTQYIITKNKNDMYIKVKTITICINYNIDIYCILLRKINMKKSPSSSFYNLSLNFKSNRLKDMLIFNFVH